MGLTVSFLNQILRIPFLLAAIVTNGLFHGAAQYLLGSAARSFSIEYPFNEGILLACTSVAMLGACHFVFRSQLGYSYAIYGNNPLFFQNHRLSGGYVVFLGVMTAHGCAGLSGYLFAQSNGFVDLTMNFGTILLCLTSLMIGKLIQANQRPSIITPLVGVTAFFIIQQALLRIGMDLKYFNAMQAIFILGVLCFGNRNKTVTLDHLGV